MSTQLIPAPDRRKQKDYTTTPHDVTRSCAMRKGADARPLKSSPRVNRVIMSSARFGWSMGTCADTRSTLGPAAAVHREHTTCMPQHGYKLSLAV